MLMGRPFGATVLRMAGSRGSLRSPRAITGRPVGAIRSWGFATLTPGYFRTPRWGEHENQSPHRPVLAQRLEHAAHVGWEGGFGLDPVLRSRMAEAQSISVERLACDEHFVLLGG
jgi:hypothetical protein